jgi:hypothetical protein
MAATVEVSVVTVEVVAVIVGVAAIAKRRHFEACSAMVVISLCLLAML